MPPFGSHGPRWMRGWSSTWPVSHASPVTCSIVCANPGGRATGRRGRTRACAPSPRAGWSRARRPSRDRTARSRAACSSRRPGRTARSGAARARGLRDVARSSVRSRLFVFETWKSALVVPPVVAIGADAAGEAHAVGAGDRLHVDHVGAERGEHRRRRRPRPPRGEVEDLDAVRAAACARRVAGDLGGRGTIVPVCSPRRGAGRGGGAPSPSIRHERVGTRNVPVGSSTIEPRAVPCSNSTTAGPSHTGATGMRSSAASATTSAVVCFVVHSWMIAVPLLPVDDPGGDRAPRTRPR